jgi:hypothetical protein
MEIVNKSYVIHNDFKLNWDAIGQLFKIIMIGVVFNNF